MHLIPSQKWTRSGIATHPPRLLQVALQCAKNKEQHRIIQQFLKDFSFTVLPFTENIGHRASVYVEEYTLSHAVRAGDAIIAATAVEHHLLLSTANAKHYRPIKELDLKVFRP